MKKFLIIIGCWLIIGVGCYVNSQLTPKIVEKIIPTNVSSLSITTLNEEMLKERNVSLKSDYNAEKHIIHEIASSEGYIYRGGLVLKDRVLFLTEKEIERK